MYNQQWYEEWYPENKQRLRTKRQELKKEVIAHYGGKCSCCGHIKLGSLCLDHINNDGAAHRRTVPADKLYKWLKANSYPTGFQVLCANCNHRKELQRLAQHVKQTLRAIYDRACQKRQRSDVLKHYGGKCILCGCTDEDILCFDHIHGGGVQHKIERRGLKLYMWLKNNKFPPGYQILCHNCNLDKYVSKPEE